MEILLDQGADPNVKKVAKTEPGQGKVVEMGDRTTPLHIASRYGLVDVIELLLVKHNVDPNVVNVNDQSALHFAAMYNQPKAVGTLIQRLVNCMYV